jgi:hypothetical protein
MDKLFMEIGMEKIIGEIVVKKTKVKITEVGGTRHTIYLRKDFVTDSAFPFRPRQELEAKIVGNRIIIERTKEESLHSENRKRWKNHDQIK